MFCCLYWGLLELLSLLEIKNYSLSIKNWSIEPCMLGMGARLTGSVLLGRCGVWSSWSGPAIRSRRKAMHCSSVSRVWWLGSLLLAIKNQFFRQLWQGPDELLCRHESTWSWFVTKKELHGPLATLHGTDFSWHLLCSCFYPTEEWKRPL